MSKSGGAPAVAEDPANSRASQMPGTELTLRIGGAFGAFVLKNLAGDVDEVLLGHQRDDVPALQYGKTADPVLLHQLDRLERGSLWRDGDQLALHDLRDRVAPAPRLRRGKRTGGPGTQQAAGGEKAHPNHPLVLERHTANPLPPHHIPHPVDWVLTSRR